MVDFGTQNVAPSFDDLAEAVLLVDNDVVAYGNRQAALRLGEPNRHALVGKPLEELLPGVNRRSKKVALRTRMIDQDHQVIPCCLRLDEIVLSSTTYLRIRLSQSPDGADGNALIPASNIPLVSQPTGGPLLPDPLICLDAAGRVLEVHAGDVDLAKPELIGQSFPDQLEPVAAEAFRAAMARSAQSQSTVEVNFSHNDSGRRVSYQARLRGTENGEVYCVLNDVTDRVRRDERDLLSRKMESVSRMAGGIAHDFNNLLTAVLAHAELARLAEDSASQNKHIDQILAASDRAADLTRTLLAFSRSHLPGQDVIDAQELINELAEPCRAFLPDTTELIVRTQEGASIRADRRVLEQVLLNLVRNARDAVNESDKSIALANARSGPRGSEAGAASQGPNGPAGAPRVQNKIAIAVRAVNVGPLTMKRFSGLSAGPHALIAVRDNGIGMTEEVAEHIFEPFYTTHRQLGQSQHDGLGLAVAYGFATQSGGQIATISRPGKGTTVLLYLPLSGALPGRIHSPSQTPSRGRGQILLVEDEPAVRDVFARSLISRGFRVIEAADGIEALRLMDATPPPAIDALVTDLVMPRLGGHELAIRLRERKPTLKVLYMSGYTRATLEARDLDQPGTRFLAKPFGPNELEQAISALVVDARVPEAG